MEYILMSFIVTLTPNGAVHEIGKRIEPLLDHNDVLGTQWNEAFRQPM